MGMVKMAKQMDMAIEAEEVKDTEVNRTMIETTEAEVGGIRDSKKERKAKADNRNTSITIIEEEVEGEVEVDTTSTVRTMEDRTRSGEIRCRKKMTKDSRQWKRKLKDNHTEGEVISIIMTSEEEAEAGVIRTTEVIGEIGEIEAIEATEATELIEAIEATEVSEVEVEELISKITL